MVTSICQFEVYQIASGVRARTFQLAETVLLITVHLHRFGAVCITTYPYVCSVNIKGEASGLN